MRFWYEDAIFYSIYPLGACNGKHENDYVLSAEGLEKLDAWTGHIRGLGCNAVYFGPVFESKTHGYDTTDYRKIDSRLGTNDQFRALVAHYHASGLKVVLDGVFNHTGRDFFAFRAIQERRGQSLYADWYCGVNFDGNNPLNDGFSYDAWRGHWELAKLNLRSPQVKAYLFDAVRYWIGEFDVDGIRLDCADCLDFDFMRELRALCTGLKADFWLMGEIIHGDYTRWANSDMLHSVTNYECSKGLYSSHNDGNMHEIAYAFNRQSNPQSGIYRELLLYNFADNHDLNRLADTVKKQEYLPTIYLLLFTMPGLPSIYYGSEWGLRGTTDRVTDWNLRPQININTVAMDNPALLETITRLAGIRSAVPALRHGSYRQLLVAAKQLAFARELDGGSVLCMVNSADEASSLVLTVDNGTYEDLFTNEKIAATDSKLTVQLAAYSGMVLQRIN